MTQTSFKPRLDILPKPQKTLWPELADIPEEFTLYGGTAVALQLGHRISVDFDFFGKEKFSPIDFAQHLPILRDAKIVQSEPNTLCAIIDRGGPVKLSFFGMPSLAILECPHVAGDVGLKIASLLDLAGLKAAVVQQRAEAKDYLDIDAILTSGQITLPMMLAAGKAIYGHAFTPEGTLKALCYFEDGNVGTLKHDVRMRLITAVRGVDVDALPSIKPLLLTNKDRLKP